MKTLYQNIQLNKTKGDVIADSKLFSYIDSDLKKDHKEEPAKAMKIGVCEMTDDLTFAQMFTKPEEMCLTQGQILDFVDNHKDKLRDKGYGTFFLYKEGDEFFVARVYLYSDGPFVYRDPLSYDVVWYAGHRHRIVVPQLALKYFENLSPVGSLSLEKRVENIEKWIKGIQDVINK